MSLACSVVLVAEALLVCVHLFSKQRQERRENGMGNLPARPLEAPQPAGRGVSCCPLSGGCFGAAPLRGVAGRDGVSPCPVSAGLDGEQASVRPLFGVWRSSGSWCWDVFSSGSRRCSESCRGRGDSAWAFLGCVALVVLLPARVEKGLLIPCAVSY